MVERVVLIKATLLIVPCPCMLFTTLKLKVVFHYLSHPTLPRPVCLLCGAGLGEQLGWGHIQRKIYLVGWVDGWMIL